MRFNLKALHTVVALLDTGADPNLVNMPGLPQIDLPTSDPSKHLRWKLQPEGNSPCEWSHLHGHLIEDLHKCALFNIFEHFAVELLLKESITHKAFCGIFLTEQTVVVIIPVRWRYWCRYGMSCKSLWRTLKQHVREGLGKCSASNAIDPIFTCT